MYKETKEDLSIYKWLEALFADAPFIKIVDAFPLEDLTVPSISVESVTTTIQGSELGNRTPLKYRTYSIDVFAKDKAQRDEYSYRILNALDEAIMVYDFDEGFTNPSVIDSFDVLERRLQNIKILAELTEKMYYRANVTFVALLNSLD